MKTNKKKVIKKAPLDVSGLKQIKTVEQVMTLANNKKSIVHKLWGNPIAAAFIQNFQARSLFMMIKGGMLFEYRTKVKAKKK